MDFKKMLRIALWMTVIAGAVITLGFIQIYLTYADGNLWIDFWVMVGIEFILVFLIYLTRPWKRTT